MCIYTSVKEKDISDEDQPARAVGIATRYGLDGPGIESRWSRDFLHPSCLAPAVKRPVLRVYHPPLSSVEVKERLELYVYSPLLQGELCLY